MVGFIVDSPIDFVVDPAVGAVVDHAVDHAALMTSTSVPDASSTEQQELFAQKLQQCCTLFDDFDSVSDLKSKEIKRAALSELVEYMSSCRGVLVESAYPDIIIMVGDSRPRSIHRLSLLSRHLCVF